MELQKIFSQKYVNELRNGVKDGNRIAYYESDSFEYDNSQIFQSETVAKTSSAELILPDSKSFYDFENAVIIFEAYKNLTPLQASDIRFWTYLAHVDNYKYMCARWPSVKNKQADNPSKYILDHWFISTPIQTNFLRHGIAGLWWAAYLTYDETRADKFELTKTMYKHLDFATRTLGTYAMARHKEAVIGILEYIQQNPETFKNKFQPKSRFLTKYVNQIGGTKPLSYFKRDFFKSSLHSVKGKIELVT